MRRAFARHITRVYGRAVIVERILIVPFSLVDPELQDFARAAFPVELNTESLALARQGRISMTGSYLSARPQKLPEIHTVPGRQGEPELTVRIFRPDNADGLRPAIYHLHGGSYILGAAAMRDGMNEYYANRYGVAVVSIDYRLAPETPFPGPIEDCYTGLVWLSENADSFGIDPDRIIVLGESAGGGLGAALAILARDRGGPKMAAQFLIYPMLDDRTGTQEGSDNPTSGNFGWTRASNIFAWNAHRGAEPVAADRLGHFAAGRVESTVDLPPAFIAVGALDLFVDEDIAYATKLLRAGVPTELHVYPGAGHAFDLAVDAAVSRRYQRDLDDALARALA